MKSLCITGINQTQLEHVATFLRQAGMHPAKSAKREDPVDITLWHQQVLAAAMDDGNEIQAIEHPGRLWEQLASDIFLANLKSKLWGWASTGSLWLLDFWVAFEPRLNFVLVTTSPECMLAAAIASGEALDSVDADMAAWTEQHQHLLRFYHRHPGRCLIVDAEDCVAHPAALVSRCASQWKLPLEWKPASLTPPDDEPLAQYLAQSLSRGFPQSAGLQAELAATMVPLGDKTKAEAPSSQDLILHYRSLKDRSAEQQRAMELAGQLEASAKENELLLLQLHQVQEELESVFLKGEAQQQHIDQLKRENAEAASRVSAEELQAAQARLKDSEQENELLLLQLHQVQEELEHYFLQYQEAQQKLKEADARWQRMLQRSPDYIEFASIEAQPSDDGIHWHIADLEAAGRSWPQVEFITRIENGCAGYCLNSANHPLLRWPAQAAPDQPLDVIPVGNDSNKALRLETLLDLASADWHLLQALNRLLRQTIANPAGLKSSAELPLETLDQGLQVLTEVFDKFPATLRYDTVSLKREQVNPDYEHLWLRFENLGMGTQYWPTFEFRLSCANVRPKKFGTHPKLEFPAETSQAPFETWFDESYDDFGAKLELRFALPNAMDIAVWQKLSPHDQSLIATLISRLPAILGTLQAGGTQLRRPWDDWLKLAREIQRIKSLAAK